MTKASANAVLYISHGGGPLPLLGDPGHAAMLDNLKEMAAILEKPAAIVVISAHWEEDRPTLTAGKNPALLYDYYGFPEESYDIQYPATGEPLLARTLSDLLNKGGIEAVLDERRGFDHGMFVPLKIMYPDADIPCVQLSLVSGLDPSQHIQLGKVLSGLTDDRVLFLGSGFSFHNLKAFFSPSTAETQAMNESFDQWLVETFSNNAFSEKEREYRLIHWTNAPYARYCHPREEHLMPLHVCYGLAQAPASQVFNFKIMEKMSSAYLWKG